VQEVNLSIFSNGFLLLLLALVGHLLLKWLPRIDRKISLVGISLVFYLFISAQTIWIPIYCTTVCYFSSIHFQKNGRFLKGWLFCSVIFLLFPLGIYKYLPTLLSKPWATPFEAIALPLGISFFTFQAVSYLVDLSRLSISSQPQWTSLFLYLLYFPKMLAGPIERAGSFFEQLNRRSSISYDQSRSGIWLLSLGFFKKCALADPLFPLVDTIFRNPQNRSFGTIFMCLVLARYQIFFDFSGYTDIARGISRLLGIELMSNFDAPFQATNISSYWRRWHMSLSSWVRDYVFVPLALYCRQKWQIWFIVVLSFIVLGLWHGPSSNFIIYGLIQGLLIAAFELIRPLLDGFKSKLRFPFSKATYAVIGWGITFLVFVCPPVVFFWLRDLVMIKEVYAQLWTSLISNKLTGPYNLALHQNFYKFFIFIFFVEAMQFLHRRHPIDAWLKSQPSPIRWGIYWLGLVLFFLFVDLGSQMTFSYSRF
jgi:alginate O-acetyltransferase complex protein AlgI